MEIFDPNTLSLEIFNFRAFDLPFSLHTVDNSDLLLFKTATYSPKIFHQFSCPPRFDGSEIDGDRARRPQAGQHNVLLGDEQLQPPGEDHRLRLGVSRQGRVCHAQKEVTSRPVPRARGVLRGQRPGPRPGRVGAGLHHARDRHRRQAVWRGRRGTADRADGACSARARLAESAPGRAYEQR